MNQEEYDNKAEAIERKYKALEPAMRAAKDTVDEALRAVERFQWTDDERDHGVRYVTNESEESIQDAYSSITRAEKTLINAARLEILLLRKARQASQPKEVTH